MRKTLGAVCIAALSAIFYSPGGHADAAVVYPEAPAGGREAVDKCLLRFEHGPQAFPGSPPSKELTIAKPYRTYDAGFTTCLRAACSPRQFPGLGDTPSYTEPSPSVRWKWTPAERLAKHRMGLRK